MTDKEIIEHQLFFEQCAKDYGILAKELIFQFVDKFDLELDRKFPMMTLNTLEKELYPTSGIIDKWYYFFHGTHCRFKNEKTGQCIEVPLRFGLEFGELDPYFFSRYIKSTPAYQPLPVKINNDFEDGRRILNVMLELGRFEIINSNIEGKKGIIVKDRKKYKIEVTTSSEMFLKMLEKIESK